MLIKADPALSRTNPFVVYTLADSAGVVQFVGLCKYNDVLRTPDARKHTLFDKIFPEGTAFDLRVLVAYNTKRECSNYRNDYVRDNGRPFMMRGNGRHGLARKVKDPRTGEVYDTVTDAARAAGVQQSTMSNHLARRTGYSHIHGVIYEWDVPESTLASRV